ncbi:MAG: replication initiation factor domain-containing protein [Tenericutes bacterium]|nr:replication initiation factor domain-containing protein [Mycoplasmatota bacterium]
MDKCLPAGGCNNIPPTGQVNVSQTNLNCLISEVELDKRILFDWLSYTFDDFDGFDIFSGNTKLDGNSSFVLKELLRLLGSETLDWSKCNLEEKAFNGYKFSLIIGESIYINFCGPRSSRNKKTTQLLMRGEGCREFIEYQNGNWYDLFHFLITKTFGHFKRIDLAIDDFQGKELDIYDLEEPARNKLWVGSFRSLHIIHSIDFTSESPRSKGYSLTFGSEKSTQLQIYDKNLERAAKKKETFSTNTWYRYEMRLKESKADNLVLEYLKVINCKDDKFALAKLSSGILRGLLEFKDKTDVKSRVKNRKIMKGWEIFLESSKKIDLKSHYKIERTIEQKKKWYKESMTKLDSKFFLSNPKEYIFKHMDNIYKVIHKLNEQDIKAINKQRIVEGLKPICKKDIMQKYSK